MVGSEFSMSRALEYLEYTFGKYFDESMVALESMEHSEFSSMASISESAKRHWFLLFKMQSNLEDGERIKIAIQASRTRFVISGPGHLEAFCLLTKKKATRTQENRAVWWQGTELYLGKYSVQVISQ